MKKIVCFLPLVLLVGCANTQTQHYYDTAKAISKDNTMSQTACWAAVGEIAKSGDNAVKAGAIALAEKCKNRPVSIEAPKRNWLGF